MVGLYCRDYSLNDMALSGLSLLMLEHESRLTTATCLSRFYQTLELSLFLQYILGLAQFNCLVPSVGEFPSSIFRCDLKTIYRFFSPFHVALGSFKHP